MTQELFRQDAYLRECRATVLAIGEQGIELDQTVFYPLGGGQAGDSGMLVLGDGSELAIADTRKGKDAEGRFTGAICHQPAAGAEARLADLRVGDMRISEACDVPVCDSDNRMVGCTTLHTIVTHPGGSHKDDLLAVCVLAALHGCPIVRREPTAAL